MKYLMITMTTLLALGCAKEPAMKPIPDYPSAVELAAMLEAGETLSVALVND